MADSGGVPNGTIQADAPTNTAAHRRELWKAAIFDSALDCIITADHEGRITDLNPAAERTFGYRRDDVLGKPLADLIVPPPPAGPGRDGLVSDLAHDLADAEAGVRGRRVETTAIRADGCEFPIELALTRINWEGRSLFTGCLRDITDRKRSEERLRRSEAYLAEGQRLSRTGSWGWQLGTGEHVWSLETFRIFGFTPADVPPPLESLVRRVHPDDAPLVERTIAEAVRTGASMQLLARIGTPGHPVKWVKAFGHPVRDDHGRPIEFIGTVVDVTDRVRINRRLRRAIRARYEAVLAERTRIARDMHDGLLQDVTGIALQIGALLPHVRATPDAAAERLQDILELVQRTGREARHAIVDMRAPTEAGDLVVAVEHAARRVATEGALALSVSVAGRVRELPAEVCDVAVSIAQEAVTNVVKHASAQSIELSLAFGRKMLRLSVADNGRGLAVADAGGADAGHFGIVGMRERAARIGAALRVLSGPGRGTTVRLEVPYRR